MTEAAELHGKLADAADQMALEPDFEDKLDEWLDRLLTDDDRTLLRALRQSRQLGVLLPWGMRGVRLAPLPPACSPSLPLPPVPWWQQESPAFKSMKSWSRQWC